jgi:formylglycine-generating enzyme required for sulfatase activity
MPWPTSADYYAAVQHLRVNTGDEELCSGEAARSRRRKLLVWTGSFADVYRIDCPATGNTWALKCFTREVPGLEDRYRLISAHLQEAKLPFVVDFQWLPQGLRIGDRWIPTLKMRWVEGLTLTEYVRKYLGQPKNLRLLLGPWAKLAALLRQAGVAHADLQHGNVLLVPQGEQLALRLVDYDGMWIPALAGARSGEAGHPAYQHPQRARQGAWNAEVDRFSHLVIYTAVSCLAAGGTDLWDRFDNGDNLLFRESDFAAPQNSPVFQTLWHQRDKGARTLAGHLALACQRPLEQTPLLDDILRDERVAPLADAERREVESLLDRGAERGATDDSAAGARSDSGTHPAGSAGTRSRDPAAGQAAVLAARFPRFRRAVRGLGSMPLLLLRRWDRKAAAILGPQRATLRYVLHAATAVALLVIVGLTAAMAWSYLAADDEQPPPKGTAPAAAASAASAAPAAAPAAVLAASPARAPATTPAAAPLDAPTVRQYQQSWAHYLGTPAEIVNSIGMKLTVIPPGEFVMGSPDSSEAPNEKPQHRVRINRPFYLGTFAVTQREYENVMSVEGAPVNPFRDRSGELPVVNVTWEDAQAFCERLSVRPEEQAARHRYRLPTEAEWEYACRAGTTTRYYFGDDAAALGDYAWYAVNSGGRARPVGQKKPNPWGLYDMHGNVWEWCQDWYAPDYYLDSPENDPPGPATGRDRVFRAGGCYDPANLCRSAFRNAFAPRARSVNLGFRVGMFGADQ